MKLISCNEGYKLFNTHDFGNEMYIQRSGQSVLTKEGSPREQTLRRGDVCGEESLLYKTRQYSLTCQTWSEFYVINCKDIWTILQQQYPYSFIV